MALIRSIRITSRAIRLKTILYVGFFLVLCLILVYNYSGVPIKDSTFTIFYWEQRHKTDDEIDQALLADLSKVNLWRPTDEFTGDRDLSYDDRILPQLLWTANHRPTTKKRIALPDGFGWWWFTKDTLSKQLQKDCPNLANYCEYVEMTSSPTETDMQDVNAVLFNFGSSGRQFPAGNYTRAVYILESSFHASAHLAGTDILCSYWRGSDIRTPYGKWVYYDPFTKSKQQQHNYAQGKDKMAAIFTSNCNAPNGRLLYVKELQDHGLSVDIYGSCGPLKCSRGQEDSCFEKLNKEYKFYLAFENSNCRDYVTEKFFRNALSNNIVPVVMGGNLDDYMANAPLNSFIHIDSFPSTEALVKYLLFLDKNDAEYNKYLEWKGTGEFINTQFFCRFCGMIHYADVVPIPVRKQSLEFSVSGNDWRPESERPCLASNQFHWSVPEKH